MKSIIRLLASILVISSCATARTESVAVAEFERKLAEPKVQLLDVRTAREYERGHLKSSLQANWLDQKEFAERTQHLDKSVPVLVYCASGGRSAAAMKWLETQRFENVINLKGGISGWKMAGKKVVAPVAAAAMTVADFKAAVQAGTVLVDVGAAWCPPCKKMEPVLKSLQQESGVSFNLVKVDGATDIAVMKQLRAEVLPTFVVFKNGKETWRKQGIVSLADLKAALAQ
ncbi:MAG: thioredoxin fold domain-containing protein [Akkermansiaceae bacterium]|nr:thioredoxin fold domain-containing protein [Akkermansiaceae bacterium]MCF7730396.1 thioredoxin fold domain-containing protein [Akkermansiaceae bacterium]